MPQVLSPEQEGLLICLLVPALFNEIPGRPPSQYCICSETQECDLGQQHTCSESLVRCRSVRARISKNGSYSRQAELRLLQGMYPETGSQQHAGGSDRGSRQHQGGQDGGGWSSDEDGNAENAMPPVINTGQHRLSAFYPTLTVTSREPLPEQPEIYISCQC